MKNAVVILLLGFGMIPQGDWSATNARAAEAATPKVNAADLSGKWSGSLEAHADKSPQTARQPFEVAFAWEANTWTAVCRFNLHGNDSTNTREVTVVGDSVSFRCNSGNAEWLFKGRLAESRLQGEIEIFEHDRRVASGTWTASRPTKS